MQTLLAQLSLIAADYETRAIVRLFVWLALIAFGCWALTTYIPMHRVFKMLIIAAGAVICVIMLLNFFNLW